MHSYDTLLSESFAEFKVAIFDILTSENEIFLPLNADSLLLSFFDISIDIYCPL